MFPQLTMLAADIKCTCMSCATHAREAGRLCMIEQQRHRACGEPKLAEEGRVHLLCLALVLGGPACVIEYCEHGGG